MSEGEKRNLLELLAGVEVQRIEGTTERQISKVTFDSRDVAVDSLYVAIPGTQVDGHKFIDAAVSAGAVAVVCEYLPDAPQVATTFIKVPNARRAIGIIAANYYHHPSSQLRLVGVTGTNGKTTIATLLYNVSRRIGNKSGLFSTIRNEIDGKTIPATHTTPDSLQLNRLMSQMVRAGCTHCFMEVTSHAIHQDRIAGLHFAGGIFTNLSHDHLDYHKSMQDYFLVKKSFFDHLPATAFVLTNCDDPHGVRMAADSSAAVRTYSLTRSADFEYGVRELSLDGTTLAVKEEIVRTKLVGRFNAYNLGAVWGACSLLGFAADAVRKALEELPPVPGRFEWITSSGDVLGVVDFAHTPDALEKVLSAAREVRPSGRLITVFGCGGNKDREKRPHMGEVAVKLSDFVIITSDNPRKEDPVKIIAEICRGVDAAKHENEVLVISDRSRAIEFACKMAEGGDTIVVAGRGHEQIQELYSEKRELSDIDVLRSALKAAQPGRDEGRKSE